MLNQEGHSRGVITWFTVLLCLLGCVYYYLFFYNRGFVELDIEVEQKTQFKLYWSSGSKPFSEKNRSVVTLFPGQRTYSFFLTNLSKVERLRVDPFQYSGSGTLNRLTLSQVGYESLVVDFRELAPLQDVAVFEVAPDRLFLQSSGVDPFFLLELDLTRTPVNWLLEAGRYVLICLIVVIVVAGCIPLARDFAFVPVLFAVILSLIVVMAVVSKRNAHPDEYVHLAASIYYQQHLLPPEIEDPDIEKTYSVYGISRLNNGEIYYLLAGKFSKLLEGLKIERLLALRSFNILLFGLILVYTVKSVSARLVALPFLLTPQLWYIFSYCVSDALGLFLCFLAGCELVRDSSSLNCLLDRDRKASLRHLLLVALLLGSMFLLKINYYPFILLVYAFIVWRWFKNPEDRMSIVTRIAAVTIIALAFAGLRVGADYYVNGGERSEKLALMQEKTAHHWYKPSTELSKKHVSMYMKERGTTLKGLLVKHNWFAHSFQTGFGKYGYFTISGSETYYRLVKWSVIVFLVFLCGAVAIRGDTEGRLLALLVGGFALALIGASVHRSWTIDFQAQGRYLFPILPMIGVVLARNRQAIDNKVFILLTMQLFFLSLYSFIFIALPAIPRS
jgi:hypothetical protein